MADEEEQRLFVGNLSSETTEYRLKKLFKKFKISDVEIKRKNTSDREVVFAYVNISKKRVDDCLQQLDGYEWENQKLKVQVAKESFLDRLKKERLQREEKSTNQKSTPNLCVLNNHVPKNKKIVFDLKDKESNFEESANENDKSEVPRKRNLPMFRGIANVDNYEDEPRKISERESLKKILSAKEYVSKCSIEDSMKKFEAFSNVWRDDTDTYSFQFGNTNRVCNLRTDGEKFSKIEGNELGKRNSRVTENKLNEVEKYRPEQRNSKYLGGKIKCRTALEEKWNSRYSGEIKRRTALEEKWNSIKEKKNLIRSALKNINKETKTETLQGNQNKMTLFDDSSDEDNTIEREPSFAVKPYLEGDRGLKRLNLKAKLANDDRFQIDERFFDADETEMKNFDGVNKNQTMPRPIKRYDPSQPVVKSTPSHLVQNKPKKMKTLKKSNKVRRGENIEQREVAKPEVSKEKHYLVSDNLKEAFSKSDKKVSFSLSAMFEAQLERNKLSSCEENKSDSIPPKKKFKFVENPFENSRVSEEEEENGDVDEEDEAPVKVLSLAVPSEKVLGKCGVWGETFFFKQNDSRLSETVSFYQSTAPSENKDFSKRRKQLRSIVRKKIQNSRRDKKIFKRKLGGKINRAKFRIRLKKVGL